MRQSVRRYGWCQRCTTIVTTRRPLLVLQPKWSVPTSLAPGFSCRAPAVAGARGGKRAGCRAVCLGARQQCNTHTHPTHTQSACRDVCLGEASTRGAMLGTEDGGVVFIDHVGPRASREREGSRVGRRGGRPGSTATRPRRPRAQTGGANSLHLLDDGALAGLPRTWKKGSDVSVRRHGAYWWRDAMTAPLPQWTP